MKKRSKARQAPGLDRNRNNGPPPPPKGSMPNVRTYTAAEVQAQMLVVEQLLLQYASPSQIQQQLRSKFGCGRDRAKTLIARITQAWATQTSVADKRAARERQVKGIHRAVAQVEARLNALVDPVTNTPIKNGEWVNLARLRATHYEQLMDLEGSRQPLEMNLNVSVDVSPALLAVISGMSEEQTQEAMARAELAERALMYVEQEGGNPGFLLAAKKDQAAE